MYVGICTYLLNSALMRARHNLSASFVIRTHICMYVMLFKALQKQFQGLPKVARTAGETKTEKRRGIQK